MPSTRSSRTGSARATSSVFERKRAGVLPHALAGSTVPCTCHVERVIIVNMRQRAPNIMKEWALLGGLLVLLHIVVFIVWVAFERELSVHAAGRLIVLMLVYMVVFAVILVVSFTARQLAGLPPGVSVRPAHRVSRPRQKSWRSSGLAGAIHAPGTCALQPRPLRFEYVMRRASIAGRRLGLRGCDSAEYLAVLRSPKRGYHPGKSATHTSRRHHHRPGAIQTGHANRLHIRKQSQRNRV